MNVKISAIIRNVVVTTGIILVASAAHATENGASVWPMGAESIRTAVAPGPGDTRFLNYNTYYFAKASDDGNGAKIPIPNFDINVVVSAARVWHNWGLHVMGGELTSWIAIPYGFEQLRTPGGKFENNSIGNINLVPISVVYHTGIYHWFYELQYEAPGASFQASNPVNFGQQNGAFTPAAGITILPHKGAQEFNLRVDYVINGADHATHYHSGNEFLSQFDVRQEIPRTRMSVGLVGYYYQQITNDKQFGHTVMSTNMNGTPDVGNVGRVLDLGPQVSFPLGKRGGLAVKWGHDMLVENKTRGNQVWAQYSIPFSYLHLAR